MYGLQKVADDIHHVLLWALLGPNELASCIPNGGLRRTDRAKRLCYSVGCR